MATRIDGTKTIEVSVRFWTDKAHETNLPKYAWSSGMVSLPANKRHGIKASDSVSFGSVAQIGAAIEKLLIREKITLRPSTRLKSLYAK